MAGSAQLQTCSLGTMYDGIAPLIKMQMEDTAEATRHNRKIAELKLKELEAVQKDNGKKKRRIKKLKEKELELAHRLSRLDVLR